MCFGLFVSRCVAAETQVSILMLEGPQKRELKDNSCPSSMELKLRIDTPDGKMITFLVDGIISFSFFSLRPIDRKVNNRPSGSECL